MQARVGVQDNQISPEGPEQVPGQGCFWHVLGQLSSTGWECLGEQASWPEWTSVGTAHEARGVLVQKQRVERGARFLLSAVPHSQQ